MTTRKFGVIYCEDAEKWGGTEGGQMLIDIFRADESEQWENFRATLGELPDVDKLQEYQAFILSGSHYSANQDLPWIHKLERFIQEVFAYQRDNQQNHYPMLVGICFGHQMMGKAVGAKVAKNQYGKFVFGPEKIEIFNALKDLECFHKIFPDRGSSFVLFQSHSEEVKDLPANAKRVGTSDKCENEVVVYNIGDQLGCIGGLSFQGHMEITSEQCLTKILPAIKKAGLFSDKDEVDLNADMKKLINQREEIVKVIQNFIE